MVFMDYQEKGNTIRLNYNCSGDNYKMEDMLESFSTSRFPPRTVDFDMSSCPTQLFWYDRLVDIEEDDKGPSWLIF